MPAMPFLEYKCPSCGKLFVVQYPNYWAYKKQWFNKVYICCSWTCFRKIEDQMEAQRTKRGRKKGQKWKKTIEREKQEQQEKEKKQAKE